MKSSSRVDRPDGVNEHAVAGLNSFAGWIAGVVENSRTVAVATTIDHTNVRRPPTAGVPLPAVSWSLHPCTR